MPQYVKAGKVTVGPHSFGTGVKSILETPAILLYYYKFVSGRGSQESIDFLIAVRGKKDPKFIVRNFIEPGAAKAVNIGEVDVREYNDLFAIPLDDSALRKVETSSMDLDDWDEAEEEKPRSSSDPDYFADPFREIVSLLDRNMTLDFFGSVQFEAFCFSVIGKPDALARELGITSSADVESLGQLMIAVEVRNAALIKTISTDLEAKLGIDANTLVLQLAGKADVENWKEKIWANGSFTIAVKQFMEARLANNKKAMGNALDTAHSIASFADHKGITKKMVASEISVYAKRQARAEKIGIDQAATDDAGQGDAPAEATGGARPDLDISLVPKVDWENFTKLYDMEAENAEELKKIAKILIKHGEDRALSSSRKLHQKNKKSKSKFKGVRHIAAALRDALVRKKEGTNPKRALKASEVPGD